MGRSSNQAANAVSAAPRRGPGRPCKRRAGADSVPDQPVSEQPAAPAHAVQYPLHMPIISHPVSYAAGDVSAAFGAQLLAMAPNTLGQPFACNPFASPTQLQNQQLFAFASAVGMPAPAGFGPAGHSYGPQAGMGLETLPQGAEPSCSKRSADAKSPPFCIPSDSADGKRGDAPASLFSLTEAFAYSFASYFGSIQKGFDYGIPSIFGIHWLVVL